MRCKFCQRRRISSCHSGVMGTNSQKKGVGLQSLQLFELNQPFWVWPQSTLDVPPIMSICGRVHYHQPGGHGPRRRNDPEPWTESAFLGAVGAKISLSRHGTSMKRQIQCTSTFQSCLFQRFLPLLYFC